MDVMSQARLLWQAWRNVEVRGGADSVENWSAELMEELQIVCQLVDNPTAIAPATADAIAGLHSGCRRTKLLCTVCMLGRLDAVWPVAARMSARAS